MCQKENELKLGRKEGYIPLIHHPGEAQVDFGGADFYEAGKGLQQPWSFPDPEARRIQGCRRYPAMRVLSAV